MKRYLRVVEAQPKKYGFVDFIEKLLKSEKQKKEDFIEKFYSRKFEREDKNKLEIPCFLKAHSKVIELIKNNEIEQHYRAIKKGVIC